MALINMNFSVYEDRTHSLQYLTAPQNKELFYYATSAGRETWKSDYMIERSAVNIYMINFVVNGGYTLTVNGRDIEVRQGDLTFLHLVEHHKLAAAEDGTEIIYFHVLGAQTEDIYNAYLQKGDYIVRGMSEELLKKYFSDFSDSVGTKDGYYEQSRIIYGLLMEILRLRSIEQHKKYPKLIDSVMCHILYTLASPSEVAAHFGYSPIYLERLFKKHVRQTMQQYILKQKYEFACSYLVDTDMSVSEIAHKVGYSDSKGLMALFSKFGTLTPLAYRKAVGKK